MLFTVRSRPAYSTPNPAAASNTSSKSANRTRRIIFFTENASLLYVYFII